MSLHISDTRLAGLKIVERHAQRDARGFLSRLFDAAELSECGWTEGIAQVNHTSTTTSGTIRGLHYQRPPHAEMKLVSCIRGKVWDVAVDLRPGSPTFLQWHAEQLSPENGRALLIPQGFAHGFQALTDDVELIYCHSAAYAPHAEAGLSFRDRRLNISWPLPFTLVSERDLAHPEIDAHFLGVSL